MDALHIFNSVDTANVAHHKSALKKALIKMTKSIIAAKKILSDLKWATKFKWCKNTWIYFFGTSFQLQKRLSDLRAPPLPAVAAAAVAVFSSPI